MNHTSVGNSVRRATNSKHITVDRTRSCTMSVLPPISLSEEIEDKMERISTLQEMAEKAFEQELGQTIARNEGASL